MTYNNTFENTKAMPGRKKVWSEEIMVNSDVICGADEKMVWCDFSRSLFIHLQETCVPVQVHSSPFGPRFGVFLAFLKTST